jgi:aspartate kinase
MIVMKFGGTSVEDAASIERVVEIIRRHLHRRPVVVVSAAGKTTRRLLGAAESAFDGNIDAAISQLEEIEAYHWQIIDQLQIEEVRSHVSGYIQEVGELFRGLSVVRELTPRGRDKVASYGELISSAILAEALKQAGMSAVWLDARQLVITDENHTRAEPIYEITNARLSEAVTPLVEADRVPVLQGYIGSTRRGVTTTLGFEGSDFTAAIVGAALDVEDIQIWTDVNGIMTADPAVVPAARTIKVMSFAEAAEVTYFGAKVLHPSTIFPAAQKNIPVHIYNSKHPDAPGTVLVKDPPASHAPIKSIAYKKPVAVVSITSNRSLPTPRFLKEVFEALDRHRLSPYVISSSEIGLSLVLNLSGNSAIEAELSPIADVGVDADHAIVCVVGENIGAIPGFPARVFETLPDVRFKMISQGASIHSLVLVVDGTETETIVRRLHDDFFQDLDPNTFA